MLVAIVRKTKKSVGQNWEPVPGGFTMNDRGKNGNKILEVNSRCGYFAGPAEGHDIIMPIGNTLNKGVLRC